MSFLNRVGGSVLIPRQDVASESSGSGRYSPYIAAKVIDFYIDPKSLTTDQKNVIKKSVETSSLVDRMPINSIWCQAIGSGRLDQHIAYPFFPPHLCLPLKPGEEVWIVYDGLMYFWMCRRVGDYQTEDTNYTFVARAANPTSGNPSAKDAFNGNQANSNSFPPGNTESVYNATLGSLNTEERIIELSTSYKTGFTPEAIPRIVRNPGDLVIQGSNNSSIKLGTSENLPRRGTVDIVAGHPINTIAVVNTRNNQEIDKSLPAIQDISDDILDRSRLYLAMSDNVDSKFFINISGIGGSGDGAGAVVKSDQVRLIAREDIKIKSENTNAAIVIKTNGDIVVVPGETGKVFLAGTESDQPYLRYEQFEDIINRILDITAALQSSMPSIAANAAAAAVGAPALGVDPLSAATGTADAEAELLKIPIDAYTAQINSLLQSIKSRKILGS